MKRNAHYIGVYGRGGYSRERIVSIMKMKKTSLVGIILALALVIGVTTVFATSTKPNTPEEAIDIQNQNSLDYPDGVKYEQVSISKDNSFIIAWPIPGQYRISSGYGMRIHPLTGKSEFHTGIDIPSPLGTDIVAVDSGVVEHVFEDNENGKTIIISHDENLESEYRHCSEIILQEWQTVQKGMVIARVGDTGNADGTHLHLGLRKDGKYINPID